MARVKSAPKARKAKAPVRLIGKKRTVITMVSQHEAERLRAFDAYATKSTLADNLSIILSEIQVILQSTEVSDSALNVIADAAKRCQLAVEQMPG